MSRNEDGGIWRGLYQPFWIEADAPLDRKALAQQPELTQLDWIPDTLAYEGLLKTKLSHQALEMRFFRVSVAYKPMMPSQGTWVTAETLRTLPLPKPIAAFFEKNPYF
jgi:adenine-specific DNA glycosylase